MATCALVTIVLCGVLFAGCGESCDTDQGAPASPVASHRGVLVELEQTTTSFFNDDVHHAVLDTGAEDITFDVRGAGDLLVLGQTYEVQLWLWNQQDPTSVYTTLLSGGACGGTAASTIRLVADDGSLIDIERPSRFRSPISLEAFFLGFGAFVVAIAIFGRSHDS